MLNELVDMIVSNYNEWVISMTKIVTCKIIIIGCKDFKAEGDIRKAVCAEGNKCLRFLAKFKDFLPEQDYTKCVDFTKEMCEDCVQLIIKTFYLEGVY